MGGRGRLEGRTCQAAFKHRTVVYMGAWFPVRKTRHACGCQPAHPSARVYRALGVEQLRPVSSPPTNELEGGRGIETAARLGPKTVSPSVSDHDVSR